jgi:hypothetical protein
LLVADFADIANRPVYPDFVDVQYQYEAAKAAVPLTEVAVLTDCPNDAVSRPGWYYDDSAGQKRVVLCPAVCDLFQSDLSVELPQVTPKFGCP